MKPIPDTKYLDEHLICYDDVIMEILWKTTPTQRRMGWRIWWWFVSEADWLLKPSI